VLHCVTVRKQTTTVRLSVEQHAKLREIGRRMRPVPCGPSTTLRIAVEEFLERHNGQPRAKS